MLLADWITLSPEVSRSLAVMGFLMIAFWPLSVALVLAGLIWWRGRSRVWAIVSLALLPLWAITASPYVYGYGSDALNAVDLKLRQQQLQTPATIGGLQLPAGTLVTYTTRRHEEIQSLELPSQASIDGLPAIGEVNFGDDGHPYSALTLARDFTIAGVPCPANGTVNYSLGKPAGCTLARPARVRGVPCTDIVDFSNGIDCQLSENYRAFGITWRAGTYVSKIVDGQSGQFNVSAPTNLYLLGSPVRSGAVVDFDRGRVAEINLSGDSRVQFHGCSITDVEVDGARVLGFVDGPCTLPLVNGRSGRGYVALPANAIEIR